MFFPQFFFALMDKTRWRPKNDFLFFSLLSKLKQCTILCERIHFNINSIVCAFTRSYPITKERYVQLLVGFIVWCFGLCKLHLSFWCSLKSVMYVPCAFPFLLIYFWKKSAGSPFIDQYIYRNNEQNMWSLFVYTVYCQMPR